MTVVQGGKKRNPVFALQLSLQNANEFLEKLCQLTEKLQEIENNPKRLLQKNPDEWRETRILRKALWIALIIEIGRLFDTYENDTKKVISFKKVSKDSSLEDAINAIHGEAIIAKILDTRNTFTAHISDKVNNILSAPEICNSNLGKLLDKLEAPLTSYTLWFTQNRKWENL